MSTGLTNRDYARIRAAQQALADGADQTHINFILEGKCGKKPVKCVLCGSIMYLETDSSLSRCQDCKDRYGERRTPVCHEKDDMKTVWCGSCGEVMQLKISSGRAFCDNCEGGPWNKKTLTD